MRPLALLCLTPLICLAQQPPADCTADGIVVNSITGEPVPRARVAILTAQTGATADAAGRWSIANVRCGPMRVSASKTGFLPAPVTTPVTTKDTPAHDVRIDLIPQAVVTGKVVDEAGDPLPNARISVLSSRVQEGRRTFVPIAPGASNDLGEFRISALPAGKLIVCASAAPDPQLDLTENTVTAETCYPGPVEGGTASAMTLPPGREARVDFTLTRVPAVCIRGKLTGVLEGMGAGVTLMRPGTINQSKVATMARDGSFEIRGVPPGPWTLSVDYWEAGKRLVARVPVDVGGSDLEGVVVHVESAFTLTGTVTPTAPAQSWISLRGTDPRAGGAGAQWDKTRTTFTINDAVPGSYTLMVNMPAPWYVKSAMLDGRDISREAIPLTQNAGPVQVVLGDDGGSIQGQLQDSDGNGIAGWTMVAQDGRPPVGFPTAPDGHFKIGGLAPGDYKVYGWDDFTRVEYVDPDWMRRNGGSGVSATVTAGQSADVKVTRVTVPPE